MPDDERELITEGVLFPRPGDPRSMNCATCGLPVVLVWNHPPGIKPGEIIPASVWGEDVTVICMCCSYPHCRHKAAPPPAPPGE